MGPIKYCALLAPWAVITFSDSFFLSFSISPHTVKSFPTSLCTCLLRSYTKVRRERGRDPMRCSPPHLPCTSLVVLFLSVATVCLAADPYVFFDWTVSYLTASPLGTRQQVPSLSLSQSFNLETNVPSSWDLVVGYWDQWAVPWSHSQCYYKLECGCEREE